MYTTIHSNKSELSYQIISIYKCYHTYVICLYMYIVRVYIYMELYERISDLLMLAIQVTPGTALAFISSCGSTLAIF